ncbi:MAG: hypothetical protein ACLQT7_10605 [Candidatus Dormibacteria bacterium]
MDEYQLEIDALRGTLDRLRAEEADPAVIDEYEVELRLLRSLYQAAIQTLADGDRDPRISGALERLGFGAWGLDAVYSFVYEAAMEVETDGRDLAGVIGETDFAASLLAGAGELN